MKETQGVLEFRLNVVGGGFWGAGMLRSVEFAGEGTTSRMFLDYDMYSSFSHGFEYIKSLARRYLLITWIIR